MLRLSALALLSLALWPTGRALTRSISTRAATTSLSSRGRLSTFGSSPCCSTPLMTTPSRLSSRLYATKKPEALRLSVVQAIAALRVQTSKSLAKITRITTLFFGSVIDFIVTWFRTIGDFAKPSPPLPPSDDAIRPPSQPMDVSEARRYVANKIAEIESLEARTAARGVTNTPLDVMEVTASIAVAAADSPLQTSSSVEEKGIAVAISDNNSSGNIDAITSTTNAITDISVAAASSTVSKQEEEEEKSEVENVEGNIEEDNSITLDKIKSMGSSGVIAYALTELGFWTTSVPLGLVAFHAQEGTWLSLTDEADRVKLFAFTATFLTGARLLVPPRLALALALTPLVNSIRGMGSAGNAEAGEQK